eukprot:gnl/MRDRNA2_/MRDRNA2_33746_c0_seq1.p1 gnl/MRDRNA2_/MRDRNA2_33746_c0~~gnl/MRDRNA2_/MRDRNA2_33746_c0_seq1.p1  ORF type:complete len:614 (-),score=107.45 gnl/MRDRNA2_/MRDRNA2_33746_c0_seq1:203-2044(-)
MEGRTSASVRVLPKNGPAIALPVEAAQLSGFLRTAIGMSSSEDIPVPEVDARELKLAAEFLVRRMGNPPLRIQQPLAAGSLLCSGVSQEDLTFVECCSNDQLVSLLRTGHFLDAGDLSSLAAASLAGRLRGIPLENLCDVLGCDAWWQDDCMKVLRDKPRPRNRSNCRADALGVWELEQDRAVVQSEVWVDSKAGLTAEDVAHHLEAAPKQWYQAITHLQEEFPRMPLANVLDALTAADGNFETVTKVLCQAVREPPDISKVLDLGSLNTFGLMKSLPEVVVVDVLAYLQFCDGIKVRLCLHPGTQVKPCALLREEFWEDEAHRMNPFETGGADVQPKNHFLEPSLLQTLLRLGADANARCTKTMHVFDDLCFSTILPFRVTPLGWATKHRDAASVDILARHGASPRLGDGLFDSQEGEPLTLTMFHVRHSESAWLRAGLQPGFTQLWHDVSPRLVAALLEAGEEDVQWHDVQYDLDEGKCKTKLFSALSCVKTELMRQQSMLVHGFGEVAASDEHTENSVFSWKQVCNIMQGYWGRKQAKPKGRLAIKPKGTNSVKQPVALKRPASQRKVRVKQSTRKRTKGKATGSERRSQKDPVFKRPASKHITKKLARS